MSGTEVLTRPHYDASERKFTFVRWQDCEDIVEHNKVLNTVPQSGDWGRHQYAVPNVFIEKWYHEFCDMTGRVWPLFHAEVKAHFHKKLKDPDYRVFTVAGPRKPQILVG